ncbi:MULTISPECIES: CDP-6-deoxy-delta-3,4-glucoseen reductase [Ralstonia]|jgi:CDP-4-dehydro-6-deoxyglucose reductase, E3|uniref:CDP-6-deoxy-L-threo-D-glycero-4-hexulose-3-dehydrase reductase n=1 Tax=Ralstonia pickettii TaxID=329 RepID=A0ABM9ISZ2_RALPI|nr:MULTISPECIES: CDP-6-deoxy-delta-3,4-glucoseen reductase [Ralstonia]MBA4233373.1 CDP-6-deoxy-delta-3,4-glucoseen reductase [Ralstonia sp.]POH85978.1 CDP-6-deoxy-delta-3,4-glucoseen reductase [Ralstonia pickettii]CAJ0729897.1 CDP-6-deoxy-L-threo-D-glycero-4-hexulose-3-dehydrase reductase [Ralstonia pickettii]
MSFRVMLRPSGHFFEVQEGNTILAAGLASGRFLPYSCRTGVCNTCKARVVEGAVDHGMVLKTYLSDDARAQGYALLCSAKPLSDVVIEVAELEGMAAIKPKIYPCRVTRMERAAPDVMVLTLRMPMNETMQFMAGQYIEMILPEGERRNYSIATAPAIDGLPHIELHIRHVPGGAFTDRVFSALKERDVLRFEGPFGTFFLREESDKPMLMLASGTGFGPIKSIVEYAIKKRINRRIEIYWGGRRKQDLYMMALAQSWAAAHANISFYPVLSDPTPGCEWTGEIGYVHRVVMDHHPDLSGYQVYACGAPAMVDSARRDFVERCRLPAQDFFADSFLTAVEKAGAGGPLTSKETT